MPPSVLFLTSIRVFSTGVLAMGTSFVNTVYQIVLVDHMTMTLIVILSMLAAFAFREALDGASLTAIFFFPFFILGGLLSVHVFSRMQVFVSSDEPVNTVTSGICGIGITLITLLIFKRAIIYVVDTFERPS